MNLYKLAELYDRGGDLSKRWFVGYYYAHPETGKLQLIQIYISSKLLTKHARRVKANEIIENINNKLHQGFNPYQNENIGYTSIPIAISRIIAYKATYTRQRSLFTIRSYVKIFTDWLSERSFANIAIESFNFQHAIQFSDYLKINRKLSNRSHNNYIKGLRTIFNELVEREYMLKNPFGKIKILPVEKRNIFAYTDHEIKLIKDYCLKNDEKLWLVCQFVFYCAIRPAEIVGLKIKYIDTKRGIINVPSNVSKNKKQAVVSMPEPFRQALININLDKLDQEYYLFSTNLEPGEKYIFPTRLAGRFKLAADKIGLKRRLYDLKHTGAGLAILAGANIKDLQLHLRHSDIKMTDEYLKAFSSEPSKEFIRNYPTL